MGLKKIKMDDDKFILTPWSLLSDKAKETIRQNEAKTENNRYIKPEEYENSSFYTDLNGNIAKGIDVDNWKRSILEPLSIEDPDYFSKLWDRINETWGSGNPVWGTLRVSNFNKAFDKNPYFMDNWKVAENAMEGANVMSGGILNRMSPTQNLRSIT